MKLRTIADRKIFPIGLGAMALDEYNPKPSDSDAISLLKHAAQQGIDLIDTADVYGLGRNEELIGKSLTAEQKSSIIIATKAGCTRPLGYQWDTDGRPEHIREAIKMSFHRLGINQICLYQLHVPDHRVSFKETIKAFKELQEQRLVKYIGLCNVSLQELQEAQKIIDVESVQNHYNLAFKKDENELLPYLTKNHIAFIPYFPLGSGRLLTNPQLRKIGQRYGLTASQLALSWILYKWPTAIPIPGTKNILHLEENMKAADIELQEKIANEIDSLY
ncbi:MAG: aldo/keto reductase [Nanoarchaeota archaeon]